MQQAPLGGDGLVEQGSDHLPPPPPPKHRVVWRVVTRVTGRRQKGPVVGERTPSRRLSTSATRRAACQDPAAARPRAVGVREPRAAGRAPTESGLEGGRPAARRFQAVCVWGEKAARAAGPRAGAATEIATGVAYVQYCTYGRSKTANQLSPWVGRVDPVFRPRTRWAGRGNRQPPSPPPLPTGGPPLGGRVRGACTAHTHSNPVAVGGGPGGILVTTPPAAALREVTPHGLQRGCLPRHPRQKGPAVGASRGARGRSGGEEAWQGTTGRGGHHPRSWGCGARRRCVCHCRAPRPPPFPASPPRPWMHGRGGRGGG